MAQAIPAPIALSGSGADRTLLNDSAFLGHPRGLAYLAFTEMWERFSFYGMRALLGLFMVQELLLPGHIENVVGMATLRRGLEGVFGPLSTQALTSQIFGFYAGLVYLTPLLGGFIADRWLGAKKTVVIGVFLMTLGHLTMVFETSFLLALLLLIIGSGCLKGNIASQVGHLYASGDASRSGHGYAIFSTGINIGAAAGPLVCGALAQVYGWSAGFGAAGILMLLACAIYLSGQKYLPDERPRGEARVIEAPLTRDEWRRIGLVAAVLALALFPQLTYDQFMNTGIIWVLGHVDMTTPFGTVPVAWFASLDSIVSIVITPGLVAIWAAMARRRSEPVDITKIGIGSLFNASASALMVLAAFMAGNGRTGVWLPLLGFGLTGIGFMWYWPIALAFVSRNAPAQINARLMSAAYLAIFVSQITAGIIGSRYGQLGPVNFWLLNTGIGATGATLAFVLAKRIGRALPDTTSHPEVLIGSHA